MEKENSMAGKMFEVQPIRPDVPIYPIGVAARLLNVHPRTLRTYEAQGLIHPAQVGSRRMFSANDIQWVACLRSYIHDEGISIPGLKKLLRLIPCWEIADCPAEIHECCEARVDRAVPRTLHKVGDIAAETAAREADTEKRETGTQKKKRRSSG
jgi:MerR family transcriptional regulator/heat shock protein HspR